MCRNVTSLIYGLPIRTYTLARAADAWPHLEAPMRFFDLVALSLRKGELSSRRDNGQQAVVERVPVEVWMLVRDELIDLELEDAEEGLVKEFCCSCNYYDSDTCTCIWPAGASWATEAPKHRDCDGFCEGAFGFSWLWQGARLERLEALVGHFNLFLPSTTPLRSLPSWSKDHHDWFDLNNATFLASSRLSSAPSHGDVETITTRTLDWTGDPDEQAVFDVSFDTRPTGDSALRMAMRLFYLEPLETADDSLVSLEEGGLTAAKADREDDTRFRSQNVNVAEPRWALLMTSASF
ncbi:hypothetical protein JCM6882_007212 [Rhodosporidiobolus microsporus]